MESVACIDFETRSVVNLRAQGAWIYAGNRWTEVLCMAWSLPRDPDRIRLWVPGDPFDGAPPVELFDHVAAGGLVEAHNAFFERVIWGRVLTPRFGWPRVPPPQWRCSAAKASLCALPRSLDGAATALKLPVKKDMRGRAVMLKLSRPRKPRKGETTPADGGPLWHEDPGDFEVLYAYCEQDVRTERAVGDALPDLPPRELAVWRADQTRNIRGIRFDLDYARHALALAAELRRLLNKELGDLTGGEVVKATQRVLVREWLAGQEVVIPDTKADTIKAFLKRDLPPIPRRVLEIVREAGKTSTRKYDAMLVRADPVDQRARDMLMYHGASTGRAAARGIQVHNLPHTVKDIDDACEDVLATAPEDVLFLRVLRGGVMDLLSKTIRGAIVPSPGRDLFIGDYSAVEARIVLWLAGAVLALRVFVRGGDIYCDMATGLYGFEVLKATHPKKRHFGKTAILGLGFGMGAFTFLLTARKQGLTFDVDDARRILGPLFTEYMDWAKQYLFPPSHAPEGADARALRRHRARVREAGKARARLRDVHEEPRRVVHELAVTKYATDVYRNRYPQVKTLWKAAETAALSAMAEDSDVVEVEGTGGRIAYFRSACGRFLNCRLPSGKLLYYPDPEVRSTRTSWGENQRSLTYMTMVKGKWVRTGTYGGKLAENFVQAVARELMVGAELRCRGTCYDVAMTVHDELVAEVDEGVGSEEEFTGILVDVEPWARGLPVAAEVQRVKRYRK